MALNISSLIFSGVSVVLALVAIYLSNHAITVSKQLAQRADESLRKSTKVAALTAGQVLRSVHDSQRFDYDQIIKGGWPYWDMRQSKYMVEPGGSVELEARQEAPNSNPLYSPGDEIVDPRWAVITPTRLSFRATVKYELRDERHCHWTVTFPTDFPDANSDEEGLYEVRCVLPEPEEVYGGPLLSSFFVLK